MIYNINTVYMNTCHISCEVYVPVFVEVQRVKVTGRLSPGVLVTEADDSALLFTSLDVLKVQCAMEV